MQKHYSSTIKLFFYIGIGGVVGILLGLVSDFGFTHMAENIRLNPQSFYNQYLLPLLSVSFLIVISGVLITVDELYSRLKNKKI